MTTEFTIVLAVLAFVMTAAAAVELGRSTGQWFAGRANRKRGGENE